MWLETGFGPGKKYLEYKPEDSSFASTMSSDLEFVLKFCICQNDKACQTEDLPDEKIGNNCDGEKSDTVKIEII